MASKRKKGGRPRKQGVKRYPCGQIHHDEIERAAVHTVIETRMRMYGMTEKQARDPMAGTAIGRLCMGKEISIDQYDVAAKYLAIRSAYLRGIGAPSDGHDPRPEYAGSGGSHEDFVRLAKSNYEAAHEVIKSHMFAERSPNGTVALDMIVVRDVDAPHLVGDLRTLLNVLSRHFSMGKRKAA